MVRAPVADGDFSSNMLLRLEESKKERKKAEIELDSPCL